MKRLAGVGTGDGSWTLGRWRPRPESRPLVCGSRQGANETEEAEHVERRGEDQIQMLQEDSHISGI